MTIGAPSTLGRDLGSLVLDQVQVRAWERMLFVECGDGWVVEEAWRRARRGYACGVDRSAALIARANASRAVPGAVEFMTWDGRHLPCPRESFHVVVAWLAPRSTAELVELLAEMHRVTMPRGEVHLLDLSSASSSAMPVFGPDLRETVARAGFQLVGPADSNIPLRSLWRLRKAAPAIVA